MEDLQVFGRAHGGLLALCIGGLYGLVIWVLALLGHIANICAEVLPVHGDILGVTVSTGGLTGFLGALAGLWTRLVLRRDIDPQDWVERSAGFGIILGVLLGVLIPGLHS
jgi:hypothetical protein